MGFSFPHPYRRLMSGPESLHSHGRTECKIIISSPLSRQRRYRPNATSSEYSDIKSVIFRQTNQERYAVSVSAIQPHITPMGIRRKSNHVHSGYQRCIPFHTIDIAHNVLSSSYLPSLIKETLRCYKCDI